LEEEDGKFCVVDVEADKQEIKKSIFANREI
jgi:hypothetical protein